MIKDIKRIKGLADELHDLNVNVMSLQLDVSKLNKTLTRLDLESVINSTSVDDLYDITDAICERLGLEADTVDDVLVLTTKSKSKSKTKTTKPATKSNKAKSVK